MVLHNGKVAFYVIVDQVLAVRLIGCVVDSSLLSNEREEGRGDVHICYCRLFVFYDRGYIFIYICAVFQELKQLPSTLSFSVTRAGQ